MKNFKTFTKISTLTLLVSTNLAFANDIIPNDFNTQVNQVNNIPVINIATPTLNGMSRNTYKEFNVSEKGVIFNNSIDSVNSQLAGQLEKNHNLKDRTARLIINEVVGGNQSQLKGAIEIVGEDAKLVITNPNGVFIDGAKFINIRESFISTGKPVFNKKDLLSLEVTKGKVTIGEKGLNSDNLVVFSRSLQVNGKINADTITAMVGPNSFGMKIPGLPTRFENETPQSGFSIDTGSLGGMYTNKSIILLSNEKGAGVNIRDLSTSRGQLTDVTVQLTKDSGAVYTTNQKQDIIVAANRYFHDGREMELINGVWHPKQ
ncbi:filamentous hemagglutinin N-terminal domain-containing protein [Xenorhabdus indica]|uniref:filamentous hemagglutinin N-terminal domain-containing protein n=1 Tax=Xenorhabdus indica TaxID=333964 RepID=UPI001656FC05|nr:filamentous hemagglutinin N-terminal domain-containing protein [Xenorhabdus indica]MBC8943958.1 ShlA/HecA/FhaA exofamily protein [Xenorhabdus indica]